MRLTTVDNDYRGRNVFVWKDTLQYNNDSLSGKQQVDLFTKILFSRNYVVLQLNDRLHLYKQRATNVM